jgi:hypothetical protein
MWHTPVLLKNSSAMADCSGSFWANYYSYFVKDWGAIRNMVFWGVLGWTGMAEFGASTMGQTHYWKNWHTSSDFQFPQCMDIHSNTACDLLRLHSRFQFPPCTNFVYLIFRLNHYIFPMDVFYSLSFNNNLVNYIFSIDVFTTYIWLFLSFIFMYPLT